MMNSRSMARLGGGRRYPSDIVSLITANAAGIRTKVGPPAVFEKSAGNVPTLNWGVKTDGTPPCDADGFYESPAITNSLTVAPTKAVTKTLTAQAYRLQVKDGSATCSYGTATPSAPLQFTVAVGGDVTITPTGVTDWCLTASGGYAFAPIPYNTAVVATNGATTNLGLRQPIQATEKGIRIWSVLNGQTTGAELNAQSLFPTWTGAVPDGYTVGAVDANNYCEEVAGGCRIVSDSTSAVNIYTSISVTAGKRYRFLVRKTNWVSGAIRYELAGTLTAVAATLANSSGNGVFAIEAVAASTGLGVFRIYRDTAGPTDYVISEFSVKELAPATGTIVHFGKRLAGSAELPNSITANLISGRGDVNVGGLRTNKSSTGESYPVSSSDGTEYRSVVGNYAAGVYMACILEFSGVLFRRRLGYVLCNQLGIAQSAIVWNYSTLAGGTSFDGSYNALTDLIFGLSCAVPKTMKSMQISESVGLGDTEIIRRIASYV